MKGKTKIECQSGVDVMIYMTAFPKMLGEMFTDMLTKARAADNQMYVMTISQARMDDRMKEMMMWGHSLVVDGYGRVMKRMDDREEMMYIDIGKTQDTLNSVTVVMHRNDNFFVLLHRFNLLGNVPQKY